MLRLDRWSSNHRRLVVVLWIVALVSALGVSTAVGPHYANNFAPARQLGLARRRRSSRSPRRIDRAA